MDGYVVFQQEINLLVEGEGEMPPKLSSWVTSPASPGQQESTSPASVTSTTVSTFSFQLRSQHEAGGEQLQEAGEDNERLPSWPQHARPRYRSPHNPYSQHWGHGEYSTV